LAPTVKLTEETNLPTSPLDGRDVSSQCDSDISPCNYARVCMAANPRKRCEHTSESIEESGESEEILNLQRIQLISQLKEEIAQLLEDSDTYDSKSDLDASQDTMQSDTSSIPVRPTRNERKRFVLPKASKKDRTWPAASHKLMAKRAGVFFYDLQSCLL